MKNSVDIKKMKMQLFCFPSGSVREKGENCPLRTETRLSLCTQPSCREPMDASLPDWLIFRQCETYLLIWELVFYFKLLFDNSVVI